MARYPLDPEFPEDGEPQFIPQADQRLSRTADPGMPGIMGQGDPSGYVTPGMAPQDTPSGIVTGSTPEPKNLWEMSPEELGLTPDGTPRSEAKNLWEMSERELGLGGDVKEEQGAAGKGRKLPAGARGSRPEYRLSDRSSVYGRAQRSDVGMEGVSAAARFNAALAWGAMNDPKLELEIARRAISNDLKVDYPIENLRVGPGTKMLEWVNPKTGKWDLFAGAGTPSFFKDVAAAAPEMREVLQEGAAGLVGGTAGGFAGMPAGPVGVGTGVTIGNSAATFGAAYYGRIKRLEQANERLAQEGKPPMFSDEDIHSNAMSHAIAAGGASLATGVALGIAKKIWQFAKGSPIDMLETYKKSERLAEGKPLADSLDDRVKQALGPDANFKVSAGQQGALPEMFEQRAPGAPMTSRGTQLPRDRAVDEGLKAEEAAIRLRAAGDAGLGDLYAQQQKMSDAMDFAVFGSKSPMAQYEAAQVVRNAVKDIKFEKRTRGAREMKVLSDAQTAAQGSMQAAGARPTRESVANLREHIGDAKDQLFRGFKDAYDQIEGNSLDMISLEPVRKIARGIEKKYGQQIVKELNAADIPEVRALKKAGIKEEFVGNLKRRIDEPRSIGELERLRKDLTEAITQLQTTPSYAGPRAGKPRAQAVLLELRKGIDDAMEKGLTPEAWAQIQAVRQGYAEASEKFNKGIIGEIVENNGPGAYKMTSNEVAEYLMKDPENARAFVQAARSSNFITSTGLRPQRQKDLTEAVLYAQEGVTSHILRQFKNADTGKWDVKGLSNWFAKHDEASRELFGWKRGPRDELVQDASRVAPGKNIAEFQRRADALQEKLTKNAKKYDERFGIFTGNTATLSKTLLDDARLDDLKVAWQLVNKRSTLGEAARFKHGVTAAARESVTNGDGTINLGKLTSFADSPQLGAMEGIMGKQWADNVRLLRDMMKVRELKASGEAPRDLARAFTLGVPGLRGLSRLTSVVMPPLTAKGRFLTSILGVANEKTQRRLGELMAEPEKLQALLGKKYSLTSVLMKPTSKAAEQVFTKLGLEHIPDLWRTLEKVAGMSAESVLEAEEKKWAENERFEDTRAQEAEYRRMGQPQVTQPRPGGETPGFGQMPEGTPGWPPISKLGGPEDRTGEFARPQIMGQQFAPGMRTSDQGDIEYEFAPGVARSFGDTSGAERMAAEREEADEAERGYMNAGPHQAYSGGMMKAGGLKPANDNQASHLDQAYKDMQEAIRSGNKIHMNNLLKKIMRLQGR